MLHVIIGGAYQGKTAYARERFGIKEEDIFSCARGVAPDWDTPALRYFENLVWFCLENGLEITAALPRLENKIVLCTEIFSGVVPVGAKERRWREETGRALTALCARADTVTRLFCGISITLKG
ncbi:MAG: bifunctional adenosylcobinamide kinase/adenosylcobinamide-phosphate guanylyltransferase [Oscillospiraceae bacterium]|nr:bifunctional adenosylcobinamide kinase/adenosylcobinamide-phosphate guanylyltransferase [Oscillospiraceae bacterium]